MSCNLELDSIFKLIAIIACYSLIESFFSFYGDFWNMSLVLFFTPILAVAKATKKEKCPRVWSVKNELSLSILSIRGENTLLNMAVSEG